jgi:hypothetical protein
MVEEKLSSGEDKGSLYAIVKKFQFNYSDSNLTELIKGALGLRNNYKNVFFIRSEIKRLSMPCVRLIDLRLISNGMTFSKFTWSQMDHIVDKDSAQEFISLLKKYNGEYTFGVYEGVIKYFKDRKLKVKEQQFSSDVNIDTVLLSEVYSRNEERMNLGVKIVLTPLAKDIINNDSDYDINAYVTEQKLNEVKGNTVDISLSGLQIRISESVKPGQFVAIRFKGLEDDFFFKQKYIAYEVVSSSQIDNDSRNNLVSLKQIDLPCHKEFKLFTKRLIFSNKKRYKISLENTFSSVRSKLYEQFYLSRRKALDVFMDCNGNVPYILASDPSLDLMSWFTFENKEFLSALLEKDKMKSNVSLEMEAYWVVLKKCSSKNKNNISYYSKVLSDPLSYKFAAYALRTGYGKVFKVSYSKLVNVNPFITSSLPRYVHKALGDDSIYRYSPKLSDSIKSLDSLLTIKELTNDEMTLFEGNNLGINKEELLSCSSFLLSKASNKQAEIARLESNEYRKEDRFSIHSDVSFNYNGICCAGSTIDVSTRGLAIKMVENVSIPNGTEIPISFDEFKDKVDDINLSAVPYKVVTCKSGILRLEALPVRGYVGILFWNKYISDNIDDLRIVGNGESQYGLKRALRNIVSQLHSSVPAFFTVKESRPCVRTLGLSSNHKNQPFWSSIYGDFSIDTQLKPLLYHKEVFRKLVMDLPKINRTNPYYNYFLLVKYKQNINGQIILDNVTFLPNKSTAESLTRELHGYEYDFRVFNVSLTKKSRMFDRYFKDEMNYLETYASHKAKKLMFEIKTLSGVLDFDDVTVFFKEYLEKRGV